MRKCPRCKKRKAINHPELGVLPCQSCQDEEARTHFGGLIEFTTNEIKEGRHLYMADTLQPYRDGALSKEYLETYGTTGIKPTEEQLKNARYTYKGMSGWWNRRKTERVKRYTEPE